MAKLYFRYGAMNCGKTTHLLQTAYNYTANNLKIILMKPSVDTKGGKCVITRIGLKRKVDVLLKPNDNVREVLDLDGVKAILVDEAQFLQPHQVEDLWKIAKLTDIPVICYGLRTTFLTKFFVGSKPLMELADELEELVTICSCGAKAKFQGRMVDGKFVTDGAEVAIDGVNNVTYEPLCGKCYLEKVMGITEV
jgi:thymidine kinase